MPGLDMNDLNDLARDAADALADELMNREIEIPAGLTSRVEAAVHGALLEAFDE